MNAVSLAQKSESMYTSALARKLFNVNTVKSGEVKRKNYTHPR